MAKLTDADIQIIRILSEDSRTPAIRIAEQLGLPESTVRGRISRLVDSQAVQFVAQTNPIQMGFTTWVTIGIECYLEAVPGIINALAAFPEVYFVAETTGQYDIVINAIFRDNQALHHFLSTKLAQVNGVRQTSTTHFINVPIRKIAWVPPD